VDRRMDGQTDMAKLMVTFHNFANVPKKKALLRFSFKFKK